jgi:hypothetical protein
MIVDTNVGFNKASANTEETIDYHVTIGSDGTGHSDLVLRYTNLSTRPVKQCIQEARYEATYEQMMDRCYWDYLRVYVPARIEQLAGTQHPLPPGSLYARMSDTEEVTMGPALQAGEKGKAVVERFFVVAPRRSHEVQFSYQLPQAAMTTAGRRQYSLVIQTTRHIGTSTAVEGGTTSNLGGNG